MIRTFLATAVVLAALLGPVPGAGAQDGPLVPESRELVRQIERLRDRLPTLVFEELEAYVKRWDGLSWDERQFLEKNLQIYDAMLPGQIRDLFKPCEGLQGEAKREKTKEIMRQVTQGGEIPAPSIEPSVVVVVIGGDVNDAKMGFGDPKKENIPRIWNEIAPLGCFVPMIRTMWVTQRVMWIGEFLTGASNNPVIPDNNVHKFKAPTFLDLFRKASGAKARDSWIVTREDAVVIYDYQEFEPEFEDRYKPTAVTSPKLRAVDGYVQDHLLSQRKDGKSPHEIQRNLAGTLTPGKLHLDVDFDNVDVQNFLKNVVAEHGGQVNDSDAFVMRLGVRLLQDPVMAPRLAVFRFGGIPGIEQVKNLGTRKEMMNRKMYDDDAACFNLWKAFRSNPYYKKFGTFVVVNEYGGAVFVGPKVKIGTATKTYYLNQLAATVAVLLGYDPAAFLKPSRAKPRDVAIKELFE